MIVILSCNAKPNTEEQAKQKLTRLNAIYDSSLIVNDTAFFNKLFAEEYTYVSSEGQVLSKQQQLSSMSLSEMSYTKASSEDVKVTVFDNAAVLHGIFRGEGTFRGNPVTINERYSTFWIKQDTTWALVAEHVSVIK
jgi:hypothetical protein